MAKIDIGRIKQASGLSDATFSVVLSGGGTQSSRDAVREAARKLGMKLPSWLVGDDRKPAGAE